MPLTVYFSWAFLYGISQFVLTSKVLDYSYDSVYRTFTKGFVFPKWARAFSWVPMPIVFMFCHAVFFFTTHCIAVFVYHFYYINMAVACLLLNYAVY